MNEQLLQNLSQNVLDLTYQIQVLVHTLENSNLQIALLQQEVCINSQTIATA